MSVKEFIAKIRTHQNGAQRLQVEMWYGWLIDIYHKRQHIPSIFGPDELDLKDEKQLVVQEEAPKSNSKN